MGKVCLQPDTRGLLRGDGKEREVLAVPGGKLSLGSAQPGWAASYLLAAGYEHIVAT